MTDCKACEATEVLDEHFEAIFDFMDAHGIEYGELPWERIRIHRMMNHNELG